MIEQATPDELEKLYPRFVFRGAAVGVGVRLGAGRGPGRVVATSCLPVVGGEGRSVEKAGSVGEIVSFRRALGETGGAEARGVFETWARTEVLGVDVAGVITARRVAATLRSRRRLGEDPEFVEEEVVIEGLRIAGKPVSLDPAALKLMAKARTFQALDAAYGRGGALSRLLDASAPPGMRRRSAGRAPRGEGNTVSIALLRPEGEGGAAPLVVDDGGTRFFVFLGEYLVSPLSRRLTVMRVAMRPNGSRSQKKASGRALAMSKAPMSVSLYADAAVGEVEVDGHGYP